MYGVLREAVCEANIELHRQELTICSWGTVSGIDRESDPFFVLPERKSFEMPMSHGDMDARRSSEVRKSRQRICAGVSAEHRKEV